MPNLFSIITIVKNDPLGLALTLQSVFSQSYSNVQSIIIDGASIPSIDTICEKFPKISICVSEEDSGVYNAMNKGLALVSAEWTIFLNAGDKFVDESVLENLAYHIDTLNKQEALVCGPSIEMLANIPISRKTEHIDNMPLIMPACHQSICYRTNVLKAYPFNESYTICADLEQIARILADKYQLNYCSFPIACIDGKGLSNKFWRLAIKERTKVQQIHYPSKRYATNLQKFHRVLKTKKFVRLLLPLALQLPIRSFLTRWRNRTS